MLSGSERWNVATIEVRYYIESFAGAVHGGAFENAVEAHGSLLIDLI